MKQLLLLFICIFQTHAMGMDYYISANVETECKDQFPAGLSFFFEQIGGYGDKSMVSQVEQILDIDLSTFQIYDFTDNEGSDSTYWKDIDEFEAVIDLLFNKIESYPEYHKEVKFHPIVPDYGFSTDSTRMAEMNKARDDYENHPMYGYPNDNEYLSEGMIQKELKELKALLKCYRNGGASKIKLKYD